MKVSPGMRAAAYDMKALYIDRCHAYELIAAGAGYGTYAAMQYSHSQDDFAIPPMDLTRVRERAVELGIDPDQAVRAILTVKHHVE